MNLIGIDTEKTYGYKRIHSKIKLHMVTETYSIMLHFFFFTSQIISYYTY